MARERQDARTLARRIAHLRKARWPFVAKLLEGLGLGDDVLALDGRLRVLVHGVVQVVPQQRRLTQPRHLLPHRLCPLRRGLLLARREGECVRREQRRVFGVKCGARNRVVGLRVDQIDCDAKVGLRNDFVLAV